MFRPKLLRSPVVLWILAGSIALLIAVAVVLDDSLPWWSAGVVFVAMLLAVVIMRWADNDAR